MPSIEESLEFMKSNDIKWVSLHFVNVNGELRSETLASSEFGDEIFENGLQVSLEEHFGPAGRSLFLVPDQDSFARIPWEPNTMRFLSSIHSGESERFTKDSRYCIERVNINAKAMGISDVLLATEAEFYLFDNVTSDNLSPERGPNVLIDAKEAHWNPSPFWGSRNGDFMGQPQDTMYAARTQIAELLNEHFHCGVVSHSHGRSATGQQRMKIREYNAKLAADAFLTLKHVARNVAFIANNVATFMPLPVMGEKGSMLALSQRIMKGAENLFFDKDGEYGGLSQTALYYIGGILEHAPALSVFTAPTTNSYKRLKNDPRFTGWSLTNPGALVHVPAPSKSSASVAYTGADPSVNPYIAYAAVVAAGLDGIKNKTSPGKPSDEDGGAKGKASLPPGMMEAISALEGDNKFLKGFISAELLSDYLEQRIGEHRENEKRPTAFEIDRYFNR